MARAQQKDVKKRNYQNNKTVERGNVEKMKKRETTDKEIVFLKAGLFVIILAVVALGTYFLVTYLMNRESEVVNPFEDYIHLTTVEVEQLTLEDEYGNFGDFTYFHTNRNSDNDYEEIYGLISPSSTHYIYFYFYYSSEIDIETKNYILGHEVFGEIAFFFIDLDNAANAALFDSSLISHLDLDNEADYQFLIYNIDFDVDEDAFELFTDLADILERLELIVEES